MSVLLDRTLNEKEPSYLTDNENNNYKKNSHDTLSSLMSILE